MRPKKDVGWRGDSRDIARAWPKPVRARLGDELMRVQLGANPFHGAALPDIGSGVCEIRLASRGEAYRAIYVASLGAVIYVLHAFQKKSKHGIAIPKQERDLAIQRYKALCAELAARQSLPWRTQ